MDTWTEERRPELRNTWLVNWRWRSGEGHFIIVEDDPKKVEKVAQSVFEEVTGYTGVRIFDEDEPKAHVSNLSLIKVWHRSGQ
jgi:hypothetical protein